MKGTQMFDLTETNHQKARTVMAELIEKVVCNDYKDPQLIEDCYTMLTWYVVRRVFTRHEAEEGYEVINSLKRHHERRDTWEQM